MKYAVEYSTPGEEREERRTRFVGLSMAKKKQEALEHHGHTTRLMPKSELNEPPKGTVGPSIMDRDVINHWKFIPKFHMEDGEKVFDGLYCMKNGGRFPLHKLP